MFPSDACEVIDPGSLDTYLPSHEMACPPPVAKVSIDTAPRAHRFSDGICAETGLRNGRLSGRRLFIIAEEPFAVFSMAVI